MLLKGDKLGFIDSFRMTPLQLQAVAWEAQSVGRCHGWAPLRPNPTARRAGAIGYYLV